MNPDFWTTRWRDGRIGFHEGAPNTLLTAHVSSLGDARRVLVPLCGKTEDLAFLAAQGHSVVGVELVEDAVRAFFSEHALTPTVTRRGDVTEFSHGAVTVLSGDVFATTPALVGPVDALYDRAALIALPEAVRARYVAHLRPLLAPGAEGLVVALEYPPEAMSGPPFSVPDAEVRRHFEGLDVTVLAERPARAAALSASVALERLYRIRF